MKVINVAIAVIHYADQYLLGFRDYQQHQGNRYEFIGGKVEIGETCQQALKREVLEEVGIDISIEGRINPLGVLHHEYRNEKNKADAKKVCLHVYRVQLNKLSFDKRQHQQYGCEGQLLKWVTHAELVSNIYKLPDANQTILQWLKLPDIITITKDIASFGSQVDDTYAQDKELTSVTSQIGAQQQWLDYYHHRLSDNACVYVRLKQTDDIDLQMHTVLRLLILRPDLKLILRRQLALKWQHTQPLPKQVIAQHLTEQDLNHIYSTIDNNQPSFATETTGVRLNLPITISCHHESSINTANILAQYQLENHLPPVVGIFLSPVNPTLTHTNHAALGWEKFMALASLSQVPVMALGGVSPDDLSKARQYGGDKVAGIRRFLTVCSGQVLPDYPMRRG